MSEFHFSLQSTGMFQDVGMINLGHYFLLPNDLQFCFIHQGYAFKTNTITSYELNEETEQFAKVFPNPLNGDILSVKSEESIEKVLVIDHLGKELIHQHFSEEKKQVKLNLAELNSGVYYVLIYHAERSSSFKLIKL